MKNLIKQFSYVLFFLVTLIIVQGCAVYKSTPVSIEEATNEGYPVKVKTIDNKTATYHHIEMRDGKYYGIKHVDRQQIVVPLKKGEINTILEKNKPKSTQKTAGLIALPIVAVVAVVVALATAF